MPSVVLPGRGHPPHGGMLHFTAGCYSVTCSIVRKLDEGLTGDDYRAPGRNREMPSAVLPGRGYPPYGGMLQ